MLGNLNAAIIFTTLQKPLYDAVNAYINQHMKDAKFRQQWQQIGEILIKRVSEERDK